MSLLPHLGPVGEHFRVLGQLLPQQIKLSTTQKIIVVSVTASVAVVGVLARYFRRKKRVVDPSKLRRYNYDSFRRTRASGLRSPNGDLGSTASSGRRSGAAGDRLRRQASAAPSALAASERASLASAGSLASGGGGAAGAGAPWPSAPGEGGDGARLTPQQLGVMGEC